ncbi:MAG: hypothetical protein V2I27_10265 [Erythrobacter sp.]|nr:hypothetical protein [Erythrobacter sp.]
MKTALLPVPIALLASLAACQQQTASDIVEEQAEASSDHADLAEKRAAGAQTEAEAQLYEQHADNLDARARQLEKEADRIVE